MTSSTSRPIYVCWTRRPRLQTGVNPAYQEDYDRIDEDPEESELSPETVGGNWGLSFRLRSLTRCDCRASSMAA